MGREGGSATGTSPSDQVLGKRLSGANSNAIHATASAIGPHREAMFACAKDVAHDRS